MRKQLIAITTLLLTTLASHAALIGRLEATPGAGDYQAYYDTEADLTWLADANAIVGSAYDTADPGSGSVNWADASTWAAELNVGGIGGWRLPDTLQPDASCDTQTSTASYGYNCTGSEMGNLFYNVLGGSANSSITTYHNANYDLFSNIQATYSTTAYWTATLYSGVPNLAWWFSNGGGYQSFIDKTYDLNYRAWAVHSGDVSAVPLPSTLWLFGSGLLGLVGFTRRKIP